MEIISNIALISINETLIIQVLSFLIFLLIINRLMFRPIIEMISRRETHIDHVKREIEQAEVELDQMNARLKEQETVVKEEAFDLKKELEEAGGRKASGIYLAVKEQITANKKKAEEEINFQIEASKNQIKQEAETVSLSIIERILDRRLT
ncbi:MAG: ATP synthase F0 subunit B [Desulfobacterales bacterium]